MKNNVWVTSLLALPRLTKRLLAAIIDLLLCVFTVWLALSLRLETLLIDVPHLWAMGASVFLALPIFSRFGLYRAIFRYGGWNAMLNVAYAVGLYGVVFTTIFTVIGVPGVPRAVGILQPILLLVTIAGSRVAVRYWLGGLYRATLERQGLPGVLIYGAGSAGRQLAAGLSRVREQRLLGFIDDDDRLHGHSLDGYVIYNPAELPKIIPALGITDVLLAMPSVSRKRRSAILDTLRPYPVQVRTLPGVADLVAGRVTINDISDLDIEDLLDRDPVKPNNILLSRNIYNKVVLVTGAGGSIGGELCRQILACLPKTLLLVEMNEFALYHIHQELQNIAKRENCTAIEIVPLLASVRDDLRITEIMAAWRPFTVYHAAAYKHVPLVEHNPAEGVRNNVWGTLVCAEAARNHGVRNFVLISTDKAVRPTNIMGASKRLAEMVLQAIADNIQDEHKKTRFSMVRFGNVLGSSGSVVPHFREQIKSGGPVTLTHADVTRYFMTIPEAAQLVIQAGAMAVGGDVFVLDMGEPVRIYDLARRMIELSGLKVKDSENPTGDIEIEVTGLRPGEKLYEELLIGDSPKPTQHPRIMQAHEEFLPWNQLQQKLNHLLAAISSNNVPMIKSLLEELVSGYQPAGGIVDWIHLAHERDHGREDQIDAPLTGG